MQSVGFYIFGTIAVVTSLLVIGQRNAMYSVLLLIASFGALSGLYILLDSPFVAVIQIIIYAGAIMVLFLFVVMLLNVTTEDPVPARLQGPRQLGTALAIALGAELAWAAWSAQQAGAGLPGVPAETGVSSVRDIGVVLFTEYAFAFEVTSVLILVAMVGAVVLARRER